jgi:predicted Fe-Mo cluster-binding NifX family protein
MKIAIATDDKKTIRRDHFGNSRYYYIYEILNGEIYAEELRENPSVIKKQHKHGQAKDIMDLLHDCQLFIGKSIDARSLPNIAEKNIDTIITTMDDIREAVNAYLNSKDDYFKYYNAKTGEFCECSER